MTCKLILPPTPATTRQMAPPHSCSFISCLEGLPGSSTRPPPSLEFACSSLGPSSCNTVHAFLCSFCLRSRMHSALLVAHVNSIDNRDSYKRRVFFDNNRYLGRNTTRKTFETEGHKTTRRIRRQYPRNI